MNEAGAIGDGPAAPPPFWAHPGTVAAFAALLVAVKLALAGTTDLVADEAYYTLWSFHPGLGYHDHPPMVAWLIWLGRAIAGDGEIGVRLAAALGIAVVAAALYRTGLILFGSAKAGALAVLWYGLTPAAVIGFQIITPDVPSVICWTLALWAVAEFLRSRNPNWWLAVGLFAGLGLLSKYTNLFFGAGLLLWLLTCGERRVWFRRWQLWAGGALALACFSPVVWWNATHEWASFRFQFGRSASLFAEAAGAGNFIPFAASQLIIVLPPLVILIGTGAVLWLRRSRALDAAGTSLLVLTALPLLGCFFVLSLFSRVEANWTMPVWPMLSLLGATVAVGIRPAGWPGRALWILRRAQWPLGIVAAGVIYAQATLPFVEIAGVGRTAELHGWRDVVRRLAGLADENGAQWVATSNAYGLSAQLSYYLHLAGDPRPVREIDQPYRYTFLPRLAEEPFSAAPALLVTRARSGEAPAAPTDRFGSLRFLETLSRDWGRPREWFAVYLAEGLVAADDEAGAGEETNRLK